MKFYGSKVDKNYNYLVLERINGPDLKDFFSSVKDTKLLEEDGLQVDWWKFEMKFLYFSGLALQSLEKAKLFHWDLKPDNFMIHVEDEKFNYEAKMVEDK